MRLFTRILVLLAAASISNLVFAGESLWTAMMKNIKVVGMSPQIQAKLNNASPDERKSLEAAIHTGDLFIPQLFSGNAFDSSSENKDWAEEVEPLLELDREQWDRQFGGMMKQRTIQKGSFLSNLFEEHKVYTTRLTCPQVTILSIQWNTDRTTLAYRATSVGTLIYDYQGDLYDFNLEGSGDNYNISIEFDPYSSLVTKVTPQDNWETQSLTRSVAIMKEFLGKHSMSNNTTKDHTVEKVGTYKSTIQQIQKSAAKLCK